MRDMLKASERRDLDDELVAAAIEGLSARPKRMSPKWFYDETGSALFEDITRLPEYYPTRTEICLLYTSDAADE